MCVESCDTMWGRQLPGEGGREKGVTNDFASVKVSFVPNQ